MRWDDPDGAVAALAGCRGPYLIGVRHHSPALAAAVPALLARVAPEVVFVELPEEFADWLPYLADPAAVLPVALAGSGPGGLAFLPFADFSPELAAIRWASRRGCRWCRSTCRWPPAVRGRGGRPVRGPAR